MPSVEQLASNRLRSRVEAAALDRMAPEGRELHRSAKLAALTAMSGTIVELGPGTGVNLRFYPPGVEVIGIEPNPNLHDRLRSEAERRDVDLEIRTIVGEQVDLADDSADHVVCTLVLCGVDDPAAVLAEVRRILRPGGTFFFVEHVVAPNGTFTRAVQRLVKRPHRFVANGCEVDRDTEATIRAAGFSRVDVAHVDTGLANAYARHHIVGTAIA